MMLKNWFSTKIKCGKRAPWLIVLSVFVLIGVSAAWFVTAQAQQRPAPAGQDTARLRGGNDYGIIDVNRYVATLPKESDKMIIDRRLVDRKDASVRIFQLYKPAPMHYHGQSDTYLYILSGRGKFQIGDEQPREAGPGTLMFWTKGTYHGTPEILEKPLVIMTFDAPARNESDTMWLNPEEAPESFLAP